MTNHFWKFAAALAVAGTFCTPSHAQCDVSMLNGDYVYSATGTVVQSPAPTIPVGPVAIIGVLRIADGRMSGSVIQNVSGMVTPQRVEGTVTVSSDCTGRAVDIGGIVYVLAFGTGGREVAVMPIVPGAVLMGTAKRR